MKKTDTRLFFAVDSEDIDTSREIFETLDEAREHCGMVENGSIIISLVKNAYEDENGMWNYDDFSDTFEDIKTIIEKK